jgi:hypothetical protein
MVVPEDQRELELNLGEHGQAHLIYAYVEQGKLRTYSYGQIFINEDFSQFTIRKYEIEETTAYSSRGSWNPEDGYMLSAPAQNREEALSISNELSGEFMPGYRFE